MAHNPDDRSDNVQKLQANIADTVKKIREANDLIAKCDNPNDIQNLVNKNDKREEALKALRSEVKEEYRANHNLE